MEYGAYIPKRRAIFSGITHIFKGRKTNKKKKTEKSQSINALNKPVTTGFQGSIFKYA